MKVLVIGGGGREHALVWKLKQSPFLTEIYCAPGNPGTGRLATNVELRTENIGALALWALENRIDLTVVGPEMPLAEGMVDTFLEHGLRIFGPTRAAARLEWSKSFAKEIMEKAGVPTPKAKIFENFDEARAYVEQEGAPIVIKADGLAASKGVVVAATVEEAVAALESCMVQSRFGSSGEKVLVEEFIDGREASVMALVDGTTVLPLVFSQDYKRLNDGDEGPNTGGMGAISPTPVLGDSAVENIVGEMFLPVLQELTARGIRFVGFLYGGVIVDETGAVKVLEFNCRLGDPEAQVILPRMESDLLHALNAAVSGKLSSVELRWHRSAAACVVASSKGYPLEVEDGKEISGLDEEVVDTMVFQAGTVEHEGRVLTKGGRVITVSALGSSAGDARQKAYRRMELINFEGMHYRRDIGGF